MAIVLEDATLVGVQGFMRVGYFMDNEGHWGTARHDFVWGQDNGPMMGRNADVLSWNCYNFRFHPRCEEMHAATGLPQLNGECSWVSPRQGNLEESGGDEYGAHGR